jgi:hypothetical protein
MKWSKTFTCLLLFVVNRLRKKKYYWLRLRSARPKSCFSVCKTFCSRCLRPNYLSAPGNPGICVVLLEWFIYLSDSRKKQLASIYRIGSSTIFWVYSGNISYKKVIWWTKLFLIVFWFTLVQPWPTRIGSRAKFLKNRHLEGQNLNFFKI